MISLEDQDMAREGPTSADKVNAKGGLGNGAFHDQGYSWDGQK